MQKKRTFSPVIDTTTTEPDEPLPKKMCTDQEDTQKNYAGAAAAAAAAAIPATPLRDDEDLISDLGIGHYESMVGNESPVMEDRPYSSFFGSGYDTTPTRSTANGAGRQGLPPLTALLMVEEDDLEQHETDQEESEVEDDDPDNADSVITSTSHLRSLSGKHVRRSLLSEFILSSNQHKPPENVNEQRRESATLEKFFFSTSDSEVDPNAAAAIEEAKDGEKDGDEDDEGTTMEDKTTLPLSHSYVRPAPGKFDEEAAQFFSSHNDEMSKEPPEFEIAPAIKFSQLQEQSRQPRPWTTDWPHFFSDDYFDKYTYESRVVITEEDKQLQPLNSNITLYTYFESEYNLLGLLDSGEYAQVFRVSPYDTPITSNHTSPTEQELDDDDNEEEQEPTRCTAVKKSKLMFTGWDDRWRQLVEVRHLQMLRDSNHCIRMHKAWEEKGYLYMEFELCSGGSLDKFLKHHHRKIDEATVWQIFYELVLGINDIHKASIAHLDLKPANILIDDEGRIRISDFGTSVHVPADTRWVKGEGDRRYMAPELLRECFGPAADIFSLGIILLELTAGVPSLPHSDESWEMLRINDISRFKNALTDSSPDLIAMIKWLITAEESQRPTASDILRHPAFRVHEKSSTTLIEYAAEMMKIQQKVARPNGLARTLTFRSVDDTSSVDEPVLL